MDGKAFLMVLPTALAVGGIVIVVMIWLHRALSKPRNQRMATLFYGFALISFAVGVAITVGPNPTFQMNDGKGGGYTLSGPVWGVAIGILLALALCFIALCYLSRKS